MWISTVLLIFTRLGMSLSVETNCTVLLDSFANSTSEFTACAIRFSRPVTFCESCVQSYIHIIESYNNMTQFTDNETLCIDKFINLDRLQIVQTLYTNSYNLWNEAKCDKCFQLVNGTVTLNESIETITFNKYFNNFTQCINQSDINETTLCTMCITDYIKLDEFYHSISDENDKIGACMDMVDLINTTRSFWSQKCCKLRKHNEFVFLTATITVLIGTLCFYVVTQLCSVKKTPTILQQRRFAESFSQTTYSDEQ